MRTSKRHIRAFLVETFGYHPFTLDRNPVIKHLFLTFVRMLSESIHQNPPIRILWYSLPPTGFQFDRCINYFIKNTLKAHLLKI